MVNQEINDNRPNKRPQHHHSATPRQPTFGLQHAKCRHTKDLPHGSFCAFLELRERHVLPRAFSASESLLLHGDVAVCSVAFVAVHSKEKRPLLAATIIFLSLFGFGFVFLWIFRRYRSKKRRLDGRLCSRSAFSRIVLCRGFGSQRKAYRTLCRIVVSFFLFKRANRTSPQHGDGELSLLEDVRFSCSRLQELPVPHDFPDLWLRLATKPPRRTNVYNRGT